MELWGGHECTVNRVRDIFRDQTQLTGHQDRFDDLARFAGLGIKSLRYPVLWERVAPNHPDNRDWTWSDQRLAEIVRLGMRPIAGLLHHGSGPRYTCLVANDFVPLFADYAAAAAARYPWIDDWTPINEPLTTARFSMLYGHWYPHACDERTFWTALLNQIDATRMAMKAIRRVNPAARLIQTEDLGQTYSTPAMAELATYYNHRRWLSWDLLAGLVSAEHPLWAGIDALGLGDRLSAIHDDPCPADIIGVNYYITGERFLDERAERYPYPVSAVGHHDVTAARVLDPPPAGLEGLLRQAWERYHVPLAVTESHLGCSREEQLRWLADAWQTCVRLRARGVDVRALTAWALLGNVDWNSLITIEGGHYEPGAFDVRSGTPRETAIAKLLRTFDGHSTVLAHPVTAEPGWWQRDIRLEHKPFTWTEVRPATRRNEPGRPILIAGANGTLGQALAGACRVRGLAHVLTDRKSLDLDNIEQIARMLELHRPWAVIDATGWVRVDDAETNTAACMRTNTTGAAALAAACAQRDIHHTMFSSDLVFDGLASRSYVESDATRPLSVYGQSKAKAETQVLAGAGRSLIVRTAAFFSPYDQHNFARHVEAALREGREVKASAEHVVTPTFVPDLVAACLDLIIDDEVGIWHLTNSEPVTWLEFGRRIAGELGLDPHAVRAATPVELGWRARRPRFAALASTRGKMLPSLGDAIARHAHQRRIDHIDAALPDEAAITLGSARIDPESSASFGSEIANGALTEPLLTSIMKTLSTAQRL